MSKPIVHQTCSRWKSYSADDILKDKFQGKMYTSWHAILILNISINFINSKMPLSRSKI